MAGFGIMLCDLYCVCTVYSQDKKQFNVLGDLREGKGKGERLHFPFLSLMGNYKKI